MLEGIIAKVQQLLNRIGQSTDTANASGNLHQKVADVKSSVGSIGDAASQTGTLQAIVAYIKNTINTINSNMATSTQATNLQNSVNAIPTSAIRSRQSGTISVSASGTINVTISAVNTAKCKISPLFMSLGTSAFVTNVTLTSPTNLAFTVSISNSGTYTFPWEVIEFV